MRLFVGLGNPGKEYEKTRHNAGFFVIDKLLEKLDIKLDEEMCNAFYTIYRNGREKVIIAKPQTYMNLSASSFISPIKFIIYLCKFNHLYNYTKYIPIRANTILHLFTSIRNYSLTLPFSLFII